MALQEDFNQIIDYAHFWNWAPDWGEVQRIYAVSYTHLPCVIECYLVLNGIK